MPSFVAFLGHLTLFMYVTILYCGLCKTLERCLHVIGMHWQLFFCVKFNSRANTMSCPAFRKDLKSTYFMCFVFCRPWSTTINPAVRRWVMVVDYVFFSERINLFRALLLFVYLFYYLFILYIYIYLLIHLTIDLINHIFSAFVEIF